MAGKKRTRSQQRRISLSKFTTTMKKNKNPSENKETDKDDDIITIRNEISKIAEESNIIQLRELCDKLFEIVDIKLDDRETKMKISSLEERISELQDERNSMEVKIHNDEIRIRNLIEDNEEQINQYDETVLQKEKEIENFRTIVERLHKGKDDETSALQLKIEKAEQETNANRAYIKHLEDELKKLEDNKDGLLMTINGLQKTIDSLNKFERHDADIDKSMEEDDSAHDNASDESSFSFGQQLLIPRGMNENNYQLNFAQELELTSQSQHNKSRNAENDISSANNQEFERPKHQNHNGPHTELNSNTQSINQSGQTLLDKSAFHPVSNHPLDPEVEIFVPDISLSQDTNRIVLPIQPTASTTDSISNDLNYATQLKILELEGEIKENTKRIKNMEDNFTLLKNTKLNEPHPSKEMKNKRTCHILGDSHAKFIRPELVKNNEIDKIYDIQVNTKPGKCFKQICDPIPSDLKKEDILVIFAGTNDLYRTEINVLYNEIDKLSKLKHRVILVSIPPQRCPYTNRDIIRLNTKLKYRCRTYSNIQVLNTHAFIKPQHLVRDGVHLSDRAKSWLVSKLTCMLMDNGTKKKEQSDNNKQRPKTIPKNHDDPRQNQRLKVHKTDHHQYSRRKIDPLSSYGYPHSKQQQQQQQQHHILKQDQYPKTSANLRKGQIGNTTIDLTTKSTNNTDVPSNLQNPTNNSSTQPSRTSLPQRQGNFSNMGHPAPPYTWNWNILPRAYLPLESMNNGHQEMMMFRNMNNLTMLPNFLYPPYLWTHPIANC